MLNVYIEYLVKKAFEEHEVNEKFTFDDIIKDEDLTYITDEGKKLLKENFIRVIDENQHGMIKLRDSEYEDGIVFKKVSKKIKNTNYFANKVY